MKRPRPVLTAAGIAGAVTSLASLAAWLGYADIANDLSTRASTIGSLVVVLLGYLPHHVSAVVAERKVTPTADPRNDDGAQLVPADDPFAEFAYAGKHADPGDAAEASPTS